MMEANTGDVNHLDSNVLLPPRKRLLACMKKQNGDSNGNSYVSSTSISINDFDARLDKLLSAHLSDNNPSHEEIVAAARSAAEAAVKIAIAARAAAEKKAVKATKAMAAAKKALELVADIDEQEMTSYAEQRSKNKTMKHVHDQKVYDDKQPRVENGKTGDKELAHQSHQAIKSSPGISKHGSPTDLKEYEHKRLKVSENGRVNNGSVVVEEKSSSARNRIKVICDNADKNAKKVNKVRMENEEKFCEEDTSSFGRKRKRMKQAKLPLSIYSDRDQLNPKKTRRKRSSELVSENIGDKTLFTVRPSANSITPVERNSIWKCKSFKSTAHLEQNKGNHDVHIVYHNNLQLQ